MDTNQKNEYEYLRVCPQEISDRIIELTNKMLYVADDSEDRIFASAVAALVAYVGKDMPDETFKRFYADFSALVEKCREDLQRYLTD